jgi:hypothetical protein
MFLDEFTTSMITVIGFLFFTLFIILILLWVILPFSIFGIKGLIREVIEEQQKTNKLIIKLLQRKTTEPLSQSEGTEHEERG